MEIVLSAPIKVLHVEDYKIIRDGLEALLRLESFINVVGSAENRSDLMTRLNNETVDVLILDLFLDRMENVTTVNGFEICREVRQTFPDVRILAHSAYDDARHVNEILKAGASGFVSKKSGSEELMRGIRAVAQGDVFLCRSTSKKLKNVKGFFAGLEDSLKPVNALFSPRELEILFLLAEGFSSKATGEKLAINERTVDSHRKNMVEKVGVKNTAQLIAFAASRGIIKK